ncbi:MAG: endopeptidase La [Deltaproteobacteria bacterium]|nr:endopeptidase La [Deltaproteobacteria bacterium]
MKRIKKSSKANKSKTGETPEIRAEIDLPEVLPVLPSLDLVAFPSVVMALYLSHKDVIEAVESAMRSDKMVFVVTQTKSVNEEISSQDLCKLGVVASVIRTLSLNDGRCKVLLQGLVRARLLRLTQTKPFLKAKINGVLPEVSPVLEAADHGIVQRIRKNLQTLVEYEHLPEEMLLVTEDIEDIGILSDVIIAHYKLDLSFAQSLLEELDPIKRLRATDKILSDDLNRFLISETIKDKAQSELVKGQHEYYLREQLRQIQRELGEGEGASEDMQELKKALSQAKLSPAAKVEVDKQLTRLTRMHPESSEYAMLRTYLEWMADLPWSIRTRDRLDLASAKKILDQDHYGLEKAKERILEFLSVRKLKKDAKGPILCFVGPPGVGKTSLGRSIARALGRKFVRMSLGGVRDEAELRGHRRTYVGALPGRIIQGFKEAGSSNPVFLLDELDKIGTDYRGDPAAALLEVLDPEQNKFFRDHYLNIPFDLSSCIFIATANTLDTVPAALVDRLEVIFISGYTSEEKLSIAQRFLIPQDLKDKGLEGLKVTFKDEAVAFLIEHYTREAGVRNLEREIGAICRKLARNYVETGKIRTSVDAALINELLGVTKYEPEQNSKQDLVGVVQGLAWTVHGGEIMPVEVSLAKGKGQLQLTGHLGSMMQESAQAAMFYARSNAAILGLNPDFYSKVDVHIHVPGGATPKDGPSAGVTIVTALVSALCALKVPKDLAMTGEITLRGNVLPVGGIKEKVLAARRYGIKRVLIPHANLKDLEEIPKKQREKIKFIAVKQIDEVLSHVLSINTCQASTKKRGRVAHKALHRPLLVKR